ncbi:MAG: Gfo/Idh/MocA family oxidoreductase [Acutalibacteraceae bacterium]|nr:Gfo/Idh/MocA family oxidoreductase [Acutalibacteraceae bacterium]
MVVSRRIGILFPSLRIFFITSICTTSDPFHEQFVLAAVKAGKPVFCEKPLAPTPEACRRIHRSQFDLRIIAALARNISAPPDHVFLPELVYLPAHSGNPTRPVILPCLLFHRI